MIWLGRLGWVLIGGAGIGAAKGTKSIADGVRDAIPMMIVGGVIVYAASRAK